MMRPIQRVDVDLTAGMLEELDQAASDLNVSRRQAVIKSFIREALDQRQLARQARMAGYLRRVHYSVAVAD